MKQELSIDDFVKVSDKVFDEWHGMQYTGKPSKYKFDRINAMRIKNEVQFNIESWQWFSLYDRYINNLINKKQY